MISLKRTGITICILVFILTFVDAQETNSLSPLNNLDFENIIPEFVGVSKGEILLSGDHRVTGQTALQWNFVPGDVLTIKGEIGYQPQEIVEEIDILGTKYPQKNDPVLFKLPFYSEEKQDVTLRVQFGTNDEVNCFFDIMLSFEGWQKISMPYDRGHLRGTPKRGMNFMSIKVLGKKSGTVFFDNPIFAFRNNARQVSVTPYVPTQKYHPQRVGPYGANIVQNWHLEQAWFPLQEQITPKQQQAFKTIENRLYQLEWGRRQNTKKLTTEEIQAFTQKYGYFKIERKNNNINGLHLDKRSDRTKLNTLVKGLGIAYQKTNNKGQKKQIAQMGIDLIEHAIDAGNVINWYDGRGFADGCFLLKEPLREAGLLQKTTAFLKYKYAFPRFYNEDVLNGRHGSPSFSSDEIYTNSIGFILCVLIMDESPEKVRDMQHFVSFYSNIAFNYSNGITDTFKPDGSHYHHANAALTRYGAYTMPMVSEVIRILSRTEFSIYPEAHERMKENVLVRRFYRSKNFFPYAYSHNRIRPLEFQKYDDSRHLALAGTPDGKDSIDKEMAAVYLRMMDGEKLPDDAKVFSKENIKAEATPNGHHTLSYHAKGIHRKDDWMAVVGAHSRYIFQKENWSWHNTRGNVKFGMFENWGSLELILPDNPALKQINNGRTIEGWDWTKIPGVTSIEAPLERIKIQTIQRGDDNDEEHLRSDQPFVGGLDFSDGNGLFVMKVHGHHKYQLESFYATKSWFFFGDLIVCLGSDIRNDLPEYSTHTCLFQNSFDVNDFDLSYNKTSALKDEPFELLNDGESNNWLVDSRKMGYFIPKGQAFELSYGLQKSRCYQDRRDTEAKIEKAWLLHGNAPDGENYEYAVKVNTTPQQMKHFAKEQAKQKAYQVLQADKEAHIVKHNESNTTACVVFEKNHQLNTGLIKGVSHSGLFMLTESNGKIQLAVSDPDLRLYEGFNSDIEINLNRKEEPSYSNHWHGHASIPSKIKVFLKGSWNVESIKKGNGKIIQQSNGITVVEFECKDGLTNEVVLTK